MRLEESIVVDISSRDSFLFAAHPNHMPLWNPAVVESRVLGELCEGATVVQVARLLGRQFKTAYLVSHYEPFRRVTFSSVSGPMGIEGTMEFEPQRRETWLRWSIEGDVRGFLHVADGLLRSIGRREMRRCLRRLKDLLETEPEGATMALAAAERFQT